MKKPEKRKEPIAIFWPQGSFSVVSFFAFSFSAHGADGPCLAFGRIQGAPCLFAEFFPWDKLLFHEMFPPFLN